MRSHTIAVVVGVLVGTLAMVAYALRDDEARLRQDPRDVVEQPAWAKNLG
jgi:hypothetical protein